jgi:hypothetical protein
MGKCYNFRFYFNNMDHLYLLHVPNSGWGVFTETTCPDVGGLSDYTYRKYDVPEGRYDHLFSKLLEERDKLVEDQVVPSNDNKNIFPELSDLL